MRLIYLCPEIVLITSEALPREQIRENFQGNTVTGSSRYSSKIWTFYREKKDKERKKNYHDDLLAHVAASQNLNEQRENRRFTKPKISWPSSNAPMLSSTLPRR